MVKKTILFQAFLPQKSSHHVTMFKELTPDAPDGCPRQSSWPPPEMVKVCRKAGRNDIREADVWLEAREQDLAHRVPVQIVNVNMF